MTSTVKHSLYKSPVCHSHDSPPAENWQFHLYLTINGTIEYCPIMAFAKKSTVTMVFLSVSAEETSGADQANTSVKNKVIYRNDYIFRISSSSHDTGLILIRRNCYRSSWKRYLWLTVQSHQRRQLSAKGRSWRVRRRSIWSKGVWLSALRKKAFTRRQKASHQNLQRRRRSPS